MVNDVVITHAPCTVKELYLAVQKACEADGMLWDRQLGLEWNSDRQDFEIVARSAGFSEAVRAGKDAGVARRPTSEPDATAGRPGHAVMPVVDELMTPGCPQCAVKHLSAALYHRAKMESADRLPPLQSAVCECIAAINLVEVLNGYKSHLWYAVGALERAEECAIMTFGTACTARKARLILESRGLEGVKDALHHLVVGSVQSHAEWAAAHFDEARRELPAMADQMRMDDLIGSIERVRKDYFNLPPVTVSGGEQT